MLEEEAGVMRNAMTTRAPCGANNDLRCVVGQCTLQAISPRLSDIVRQPVGPE